MKPVWSGKENWKALPPETAPDATTAAEVQTYWANLAPKWPANLKTFEDWFDAAFLDDDLIADVGHRIVKKERGG